MLYIIVTIVSYHDIVFGITYFQLKKASHKSGNMILTEEVAIVYELLINKLLFQ